MVKSQKPLHRLQPGEGMKGYFPILEDKLLSIAGFAPVLFNLKVRQPFTLQQKANSDNVKGSFSVLQNCGGWIVQALPVEVWPERNRAGCFFLSRPRYTPQAGL